MARHLAEIFGTEKDRVNCPFFYKIGACRHGDKCSRLHNRPPISQTLLLAHMYAPPVPAVWPAPDDVHAMEQLRRDAEDHFLDFMEDIHEELSKFGPIEDMVVCDNTGPHLLGNVYVKFETEDDAEKAFKGLTGRFYGGRLIMPEYSPVTDFREARCRQHDVNACERGGTCNFMHVKPLDPDLERKLFGRSRRQRRDRHKHRDNDDDRSHRDHRDRRRRSRSRSRSRDRDRRRRDRSRDRDDRDRRDRDRGSKRDRRDRSRDRDDDRDRRDKDRDRERSSRRRERSREPEDELAGQQPEAEDAKRPRLSEGEPNEDRPVEGGAEANAPPTYSA